MGEKKRSRTPQQEAPTVAVHVADGDLHGVGIGNLRVMLIREDDSWFAQGLEIDYCAQGESVEDVKKRFEHGLYATIDEHLQIYGSVAAILEPAPSSIWREFLTTKPQTQYFSQFTVHWPQAVPEFAGILYFDTTDSDSRKIA